MKKETLLILVAVMTSALVGIMLLQIIWLSKGVNESGGAFSNKVHWVLEEVSKEIRKKEQQKLYNEIDDLGVQIKKMPKKQSFSLVKEDPINKVFYIYKQEVLVEENLIISNKGDSLNVVKEYAKQLKTELPKLSENQTTKSVSPNDYNLFAINNLAVNRYVKLRSTETAVENRVSIKTIDSVLAQAFNKYTITAAYEFAILRKDSTLTKLATQDFLIDEKTYFSTLFFDTNDQVEYLLAIYFPTRDQMVKGPIFGQFILAALLIAIVVSVFGISLYYMMRQRKISEIKTDFVNNMTHEFKTPIATIGVAVAALKNPRILNDQDKIKHYANLIKQENKRLNAQVEMVLRMSRLEKNQIDLDIQETDLIKIVKIAVDHIRLIVENRNGTIFEKYPENPLLVKVDTLHLGNVILNVLDNANKYSPQFPEIAIRVFQQNGYACVEIQDKGMGMSKSVQKMIFEKFYREETGDIHNIKGHGLGLAYLRKIIDLHKGTIEVKSEKGKGSKFVIKIPL